MSTTEFEQKLQQMNIDALIDFALGTEDFRLFAAKLDALAAVAGRCKKYGELGFRPDLVMTVFQKKAALLSNAATIKTVPNARPISAEHSKLHLEKGDNSQANPNSTEFLGINC